MNREGRSETEAHRLQVRPWVDRGYTNSSSAWDWKAATRRTDGVGAIPEVAAVIEAMPNFLPDAWRVVRGEWPRLDFVEVVVTNPPSLAKLRWYEKLRLTCKRSDVAEFGWIVVDGNGEPWRA